MTEPRRKVTREMQKAETWLMSWNARVEAEQVRHADRIEALRLEREERIDNLPEDVRAAIVAAKVIEEET